MKGFLVGSLIPDWMRKSPASHKKQGAEHTQKEIKSQENSHESQTSHAKKRND